jgi:hypothetical protein
MSSFTAVGPGVWDWPKWPGTSYQARNLWWALYTGYTSKRIVPGLFHGGMSQLAEDARMGYQEAVESLTELRDRHMADADPVSRVIRLTELPDKLEKAPNGRCLRGWFRAFRKVPQCEVRDAHALLLAWLQEPMTTDDHRKAWSETFATVPMPLRSPFRASDPNRFGNGMPNGIGYGIPPQAPLFPPNNLETVPDTVSDTVGRGRGLRDQDQREGESEREGGPPATAEPLEVSPEMAKIFGADLVAKLQAGYRPPPAPAEHADLARRRR